MSRARPFRTGLSWLRHRAANLRRRLAALRFNPSRKQRIMAVGAGLFVTGAIFGAQGRVGLALLYFTLGAGGLWRLHDEADEQ